MKKTSILRTFARFISAADELQLLTFTLTHLRVHEVTKLLCTVSQTTRTMTCDGNINTLLNTGKPK